MRVLLMNIKKDNALEVAEVTNVFYDDDIRNDKDFDETQCVEGLLLEMADGDKIGIPGIEKEECNRICRELMEKGCFDLSSYEEYEYTSF